MKEIIKSHDKCIYLSIVFSIVSSISLIAAAWVNSENINQTVLKVLGLVFWIGLALEQALFWKANKLRKDLAKNDKGAPTGKIGLLSHGTTKSCFVADVVFAGSLILFVICMLFHFGEELLQYILISLLVLSFRMHCILNGINYRYKKYKEGKS